MTYTGWDKELPGSVAEASDILFEKWYENSSDERERHTETRGLQLFNGGKVEVKEENGTVCFRFGSCDDGPGGYSAVITALAEGGDYVPKQLAVRLFGEDGENSYIEVIGTIGSYIKSIPTEINEADDEGYHISSYIEEVDHKLWGFSDEMPVMVTMCLKSIRVFKWIRSVDGINKLERVIGKDHVDPFGMIWWLLKKELFEVEQKRVGDRIIKTEEERCTADRAKISRLLYDTAEFFGMTRFLRLNIKPRDYSRITEEKEKGKEEKAKEDSSEANDNASEPAHYTAESLDADGVQSRSLAYRLEHLEGMDIAPGIRETLACELFKWYSARNEAQEKIKNGEIRSGSGEHKKIAFREILPNFAFLGEPGTGKTTLAKKLAEEVLGAKFKMISGADLKGAYIGHTKPKVVRQFKELRDECLDDTEPAVLFIDEAYNLFNDKDSKGFASDAIEVLLKATEPDERVLRERDPDSKDLLDVTLENNTAVWFAGYEDEMRKALSANKGMYRRVNILTLPNPKQDELWESFIRIINGEGYFGDKNADANREVCVECKAEIEKYFRWGRSKTYAEFFGNFAGVKRFAEKLENYALSKGRKLLSGDITGNIIEPLKKEIRAQYQHVIKSKYDRMPFMVYTDIEEELSPKYYIGGEGAVEKMRRVVEMICSPESYPDCTVPKGALLVGPPGTGKTYLSRCMAGELEKTVRKNDPLRDTAFIKLTAAELKTPELVKLLFSTAEGYDNAIIFIDEIDAINENGIAVCTELMNELDGFENRSNIFVLAATNVPSKIYEPLKRPGRFDMQIEVGYPDRGARRDLISRYMGKIAIGWKWKEKLAMSLRGKSQVEIKSLLNEALVFYYDCIIKLYDYDKREAKEKEIKPWFRHREAKANAHTDASVMEVELRNGTIMVPADKDKFSDRLFTLDVIELLTRKSLGERSENEGDKKSGALSGNNDESAYATAVHEVGHALVSYLLGIRFSKISVLSRNRALGFVEPLSDQSIITKQDYINNIDIDLGGRAAEEIRYGAANISVGASADIQHASKRARDMIMRLGMSEKIGPVALIAYNGNYIGNDKTALCPESTLAEAEEEVRKLLRERMDAVVGRLREHSEAISRLAEEVLKREELTGNEFFDLCRKNNIDPIVKSD